MSTAPPPPIGLPSIPPLGSDHHDNRPRPHSGGVAPIDTAPFHAFDDEEKLSPLGGGSGLGPIGPPHRQPKSNMTPPLTAASGGGSKPSSAPPSAHGFSPSAAHLPHSKTSPPSASGIGGGRESARGINASPQLRNDLSSVMKSPLLGAAPPGLLPPPDKGMYVCAYGLPPYIMSYIMS